MFTSTAVNDPRWNREDGLQRVSPARELDELTEVPVTITACVATRFNQSHYHFDPFAR
jgi:hypothetical protein